MDIHSKTFFEDLISNYCKTVNSPKALPETTQLLINYLNFNKGQVDKKYWLCLFDMRHFENNKVEFSKAADLYAKTLKELPPSWVGEEIVDSTSVNLIKIVDLNDISKTRVDDFIKDVRKRDDYSRIDFSSVSLEINEINSLEVLLYLLKTVQGEKCQIIGHSKLVKFLQDQVQNRSKNKSFWLLLFSFYQWLGQEVQYNELVDLYLQDFEETVPEYQEKYRMNIKDIANGGFVDPRLVLNLKGVLTKQDVIYITSYISTESENIDMKQNILKRKNERKLLLDAKEPDEINIDMGNVKGIQYGALEDLVNFLLQNKHLFEGKSINFNNLRQIILSSLQLVGINEFPNVSLNLIKY
jgi:hypothetical protein